MGAPHSLDHWLSKANELGLHHKVLAAVREIVNTCPAAPRKARKSRSAKAKGRRAVLEVRDLLYATFPDLQEDDILIQTTSVGGQDVHLSPLAASKFGYAIECKNVEALNIWKTIEQARLNGVKKGRPPVIFIRRNTTPLHVVIQAEEFMRLVRG